MPTENGFAPFTFLADRGPGLVDDRLRAFALAVGIMLAFFPATLKALEQHANRWYSTRKALAGAETMHTPLDTWVERHPRTAGLIITAAALIVVVSSGLTLFN